MGCGASMDGFPSKQSRKKEDLVETKHEKIPDDFTIPENKYYPRPRPPRDRKDHIYTPGGYSELEEKARNADFDICISWHIFTKYLTQGMTTDIEKVRSLFVWMGSKNFKKGKIPNGIKDCPLHDMRKVQMKSMSYAAFFVKICRVVGLKAIMIKGIAKSVAYDVGDPFEEVKTLSNKWVAVHVNGDWRIIFPLWAFSAVEGTKGTGRMSSGSAVRKVNEFFFLTDPDIFVHFCLPDDSDWQLLTVPLTLERFLGEPFYRQPYFKNKLHCPTLVPGILEANHGIVEIRMRSLLEKWKGQLNYELFFNKKESNDMKLPRKTQLVKYVIMDRNNGNWKFTVRFPINGVYKLTINGGVTPNDNEWICDFKLICTTANEDIEPLPCTTGAVGWGPGTALNKVGLIEPTQQRGTILAKLRQRIYVCFTMTKKLLIRSELLANKYKPTDLSKHIDQRIANRELTVIVTVPTDGEYALRMFARENKSLPEENVCNYLITTDDPLGPKTYRRENAFEKNLRKQLVTKTRETRDPEEMGKIIEQFDKLALEDKGDLKKAKIRRDFLKIRKDLADATERRHFNTLDSALKRTHESKFEPKLKATTKKAQTVRDEVYLNWIHEVLEMKQTTVAELKSYRNPPPAIFDTMQAVFILLGENGKSFNTWDDIHVLISHLGNDSLLHRVTNFQTTDVREHALEEADKLIEIHDLTSIKQKSPAAGTFYVWVRDLVKMIKDERANPKRKKKKREISPFSKETTKSPK